MSPMPTIKKNRHVKRSLTVSSTSRLNGYNKKRAAKARRRAERLDPENTLPRYTKGYAD